MKRLVPILLAIILLTVPLSAIAKDEITFRGIPWFSTKSQVEEALLADGATKDEYGPYPNSIALINTSMDDPDLIEGGGCWGVYKAVTVAGHEVSETIACFMYPIVNDKVLRDVELAEFYMGAYVFESTSSDGAKRIYDDLVRKLTLLYGDGKVIKTADEQQEDPVETWTDPQNNVIMIFNDSSSIVLIYIAGEADSRFDELKKALGNEVLLRERYEGL